LKQENNAMFRRRLTEFITALAFLSITFPNSDASKAARKQPPKQIAGHNVLRVYDSENSGLAQGDANTVFQDRDGRFWFGTFLGVVSYDEQQDTWNTFTSKTVELIEGSIGMIGQSRDGSLWFATYPLTVYFGPGVSRFDGKRWQRIDVRNSTLGSSKGIARTYPVDAMFQGRNRSLWFAVEDGLIRFDGKEWTPRFKLSRLLKESAPCRVDSGLQDSEGYMWLAIDSNGVWRIDDNLREYKRYNPMQSHVKLMQDGLDDLRATRAGMMLHAVEDRVGRVWFAAHDGYVYAYDKRKDFWTAYDLADHLPMASRDLLGVPNFGIRAIYQDAAGRMMFGTSRGLLVFIEDQGRWELLTKANSALPYDSVNAILEDRSRRIWIATGKGVLVLE
jgi:ligand-binding sensor domain-containing protein